MPEVDIGPLLNPDDRFGFAESHRPALVDGSYTLAVKHHLEVVQKRFGVDMPDQTVAKRSQQFLVAGPRFVLAPGEVASCFPPAGADGDFAAVMPHLFLNRASLPWERTAVADEGRDGPPWLALLVLTADEILDDVSIAVPELLADGAKPLAKPDPRFKRLLGSPGDDPKSKQQARLIEISSDLAEQLLPDANELALLSGVRTVNDVNARAMLVAKRLPMPDKRNQVHLVSVEHQYQPLAKPSGNLKHGHWLTLTKPPSAKPATIRLVSLMRWQFSCAKVGNHLGKILNALQIRRPSLEQNGLGLSQGAVEAGAIPLEYRLGDGQRSAAWYHGPLAARSHGAVLPLPARRAEQLLLTERATGMPDLSYASAWELGRMLALRDPAVGIRLNQWKRRVAHAGHASQWLEAAPAGMELAPSCPCFELAEWFENALGRLAKVPFCYLLPEPALLPEESLMFFMIDPEWVGALFDGAFSIGRHDERQRLADRELRSVLPPIRPRWGVLLRSEAVSGWPDLLVEGFAGGGRRTQTLRFERLARDSLLVLFDGRPSTVQIHPHPQAQHFELDASQSGKFVEANRAIRVADFARQHGASGSHQLAPLLLARGVPKVSYQLSGGGFA